MKYQRGATLIVALILLAIVTLVGAAGIRGTSLEMKMIASARDRSMAFEAAEATLRNAELELIKKGQSSFAEDGTLSPAEINLANIATVYTENCSNGKCFKGQYDSADPYRSCKLFKDGEVDFSSFWQDESKYASTSVKVAEADEVDTKFLVEFMCFTIKERGLKGTIDDKEVGDEDLIYMPLFRITAVAEGLGKRATVMAQSMVKVNIE